MSREEVPPLKCSLSPPPPPRESGSRSSLRDLRKCGIFRVGVETQQAPACYYKPKPKDWIFLKPQSFQAPDLGNCEERSGAKSALQAKDQRLRD